jgi:ABC-type transport system substrate-binding protein
MLGATLTGGAIGATFLGTASAQTDTSSTSSTPAATTDSSTAPTNAPAPHDPSKGGHTANGITEELLTGDTATQVSDAAQEAVPDGTIQRVENDAEGATYEAHMVKADGSHVTVKVNADFSVASIETGR